MDDKQLQEQIVQLREAVEALSASEADKEKLAGLVSELEGQVSEPLLVDSNQSLVEQVDAMVSSFERDHPTASGILNNIMVTLTSMGV